MTVSSGSPSGCPTQGKKGLSWASPMTGLSAGVIAAAAAAQGAELAFTFQGDAEKAC